MFLIYLEKYITEVNSMIKKRISLSQTVYLLMILVISTADIFLPAIIARQAGRDAWISVLIATALSIVFGLIWLPLASRFPDETFPDYLPKILGQPLGGLLGLLYVLFFLSLISVVAREFGALAATAFLPLTPVIILEVAITAISVYAALEDIEVIARTNEALFPLGLFLLVSVFILTTKDMEFKNYLPILENGLKPPILGALTLSAWMGETFLMLYLYPYINNKNMAVYGIIGSHILIGGGLLLGTSSIALFGAELTADIVIPPLAMVQIINLANFIQRLDAVIMATWVGGIFIKLSLFIYVAALSLSSSLNVRSYKPFVVPLTGIALPISILSFENITEIIDFLEKPLPFYLLTWEVLVPLIVLIIAVIKYPNKQRK